MPDESSFKIVVLGLYVSFISLRLFFGLKVMRAGGKVVSREPEAIEREGRILYFLRAGMEFVLPASIILYVFGPSRWVDSFALPLPAAVRLLGAAVSLCCLALLVSVHRALGREWSVCLHLNEQHKLITSGPYARVRHPMYTALFGSMVGLALASANLIVLLPRAFEILLLHSRIRREEAMMLEQFGPAYRAYSERTGRLLPRFNR